MPSNFQHLYKNRKWILILIAFATINAILNIGVIVSENIAHHHEIEWTFYLINEFTGSFILILFIPPLFWVFNKWPLRMKGLLNRLLFYTLVSMLFGFLFTSLMYGIRVPLYKLVGITRLHEIFNDLPYRYLMEYFKQFFTFWLIYIVYWAINQYQSNRKKEIQESLLKEELLKSQIQSLQMQLHPHFFFNTLNTISSVMYTDPARADKLISRLSSFLRNVIQLKDQPVHSLKDEISLLKQFTDVMLERYPDKLKVEYLVPEDCLSCEVPVLLLQPLVENAIQYAIDFQDQTLVQLKAQLSLDTLNIHILDNGPGIQEGSISQGTGLSATLQRLEKLYKDQYHFELKNETKGGLSVHISLPNIRHEVSYFNR